jgi:ankyrin repeat protein
MAPPSSEKTSHTSSADPVDPTGPEKGQRKVCFELPFRHPTRLDDIPEEEDTFEECVNNFVKQEDDQRWRCKVLGCTKLFISQHFWRKHVTNRHPEWLETLKEEKVTFQESVEMSYEANDETSSIGSWEDLSQFEPADAKEGEVKVIDETSPNKKKPFDEDYNEFFTAAGYGDIDLLNSLIERGVDVNHLTTKGYSALVIAIYEGQLDVMTTLLKNGADFNLRVNRLPPIVHAALSERGPQCIMALTDHGATLTNAFGKESWNILHLAAHKGRIAVVDYLEKKMDLEKADSKGRTPLLLAAESGHLQVSEYLLKAGANINARSNNGGNVLTWSSCNDHVKSVKFWLDRGVDVNSRDESGLSKSRTCMVYSLPFASWTNLL